MAEEPRDCPIIPSASRWERKARTCLFHFVHAKRRPLQFPTAGTEKRARPDRNRAGLHRQNAAARHDGWTMVGPSHAWSFSDMRGPTENLKNDDDGLLARLREGDEGAFRHLFRTHHASMVSFAHSFIRDRTAAEEAVQDTWIAVMAGISSFEGRSSLKSWIFAIVANKARTKAKRESRMVPFASFGSASEPALDADRFTPEGSWDSPPGLWSDITPERVVAGRELLSHVRAILETLPASQRTVVTLRDIEGLSAPETCEVLEISEANQRILLHRGRSRIRQAIEDLLEGKVDASDAEELAAK